LIITFTKNSKYPLKQKDKVLMSTAGAVNLFGKIWIAQKEGLPIVNTLHQNGSSSG
jgi:hypothetical protein